MDDFGWACPQCRRNNISDPVEVELGATYCDDCGARVEIELQVIASSVKLIERGTNHDDEEE